jgi:hypothetical protein
MSHSLLSSRFRRGVALAVASVVLSMAVPALAGPAAQASCRDRFPDEPFEYELSAGVARVFTSGIGEEMARRWATTTAEAASIIDGTIGGLDGVAVCVFADDLPLDGVALGWHENQRLRAAAFGDEGLIVVSSWLIGTVEGSIQRGLVHLAQWRSSEGTYPAGFAEEVLGWYRNRFNNTTESVRLAFVRQNVGLREPWPPTPWLEGPTISDPIVWNPEAGFGGAGDFARFAVDMLGPVVVADPRGSAADIEAADEAWRQALFDESGSIPGGSREWIVGAFMVAGTILFAVWMAYQGRRDRERIARELREAAFADAEQRREIADEQAVRPLVAVRASRTDPRVRGRSSGAGPVDSHDRDRSPSGGGVGTAVDRVSPRDESGDDAFRHPDFDGDR